MWEDLGRAPRTIDAYARGLAEYLQVCEREGVEPAGATWAHVAAFVRELTARPSRQGANVVALDSGAGLANATLQQRLVPVRLFYDFLIEEGLRDSNPVGRGRYTPGRRFGGWLCQSDLAPLFYFDLAPPGGGGERMFSFDLAPPWRGLLGRVRKCRVPGRRRLDRRLGCRAGCRGVLRARRG